MGNRRQRHKISPPPLPAKLHSKFISLVSRHEQVKVSYHGLKSQINTGLLQAQEVFASLAMPLMRLVGLKTAEMADEGRFTSIVFDAGLFYESQRSGVLGHESSVAASGQRGEDRNNRIVPFEEESFSARAAIASKELVENQRMQLTKLVGLLKQIEVQVNSHQDDIFQTLYKHHDYLRKFFKSAIHFVSTLHAQDHNTVIIILKLFQMIFNNINAMLVSVEDGVQDLMQGLSEQMCNPMVEYVNSQRRTMKNGTYMHLLVLVEQMERMIRDGRLELEDTKRQARVAEMEKLEALSKLKATEEKVRRMNLNIQIESRVAEMEKLEALSKLKATEEKVRRMDLDIQSLSEASTGDTEPSFPCKKKRRYLLPESPMGPKELLYLDTNNKPHTRMKPLVNHRPVTRSRTAGPSLRTPCSTTSIPLGSSPSAIQPAFSRKRIA